MIRYCRYDKKRKSLSTYQTGYAALACSIFLSSSFVRFRTRGVPVGELILTTLPEGSLIDLYSLVRIGKLLAGICMALVYVATVYSVLWR